jgi:hypothetical protein
VAAGSQQQPATAQNVVELQKLKDNLYLLVGGGGNYPGVQVPHAGGAAGMAVWI